MEFNGLMDRYGVIAPVRARETKGLVAGRSDLPPEFVLDGASVVAPERRFVESPAQGRKRGETRIIGQNPGSDRASRIVSAGRQPSLEAEAICCREPAPSLASCICLGLRDRAA